MRVINFERSLQDLNADTDQKHVASFELVFETKDGKLYWRGWSVRRNDDKTLYLQAPLLYAPPDKWRKPMVVLESMESKIMLRMIRIQLKEKHGLEIPEPKKWPKRKTWT